MSRKQKKALLGISLLALLVCLSYILSVILGDPQPASVREFLEDLKSKVASGQVVVPQIDWEEWRRNARADAEGLGVDLCPSMTAERNFKTDLYRKLVDILRKDPEAQAQGAIEAFYDEDIRKICDTPLQAALWEVGTGADGSWRADNPIFKSLVAKLQTEPVDSRVRARLVGCLRGTMGGVNPWDGHYPSKKDGFGDNCDRHTVEILRSVLKESVADDDLLLYIGANIYNSKWPDLLEWFEKVASEETRAYAYSPMITRAVYSDGDRERFIECLGHARRTGDYMLMAILAYSAYRFLPQDTALLADVEFYRSVIRPFLIELVQLPRTSYGGSKQQWLALPEAQRKKERTIEMARTGAHNGLANINDSEAIDILERAVLNESLPELEGRRAAFWALGRLHRQPTEAIGTALRILAENPNLPPEIRAAGYDSICQLWFFPNEDGMFFQRDPQFVERTARFRELLQKDIKRQAEQFVWHMETLAKEYIQRFDKALADEIIDVALNLEK
jgi:hypothetical protein